LRFCPRCRSVYTSEVRFCGLDGSGLVESEANDLIGAEIDRYRVMECIGMGASGCVYRVQHTVLEQEHAMKILFGDLSQDARVVERFRREAKAVSRMRHPNILSVTDFGRTQDGLTFLVMEYVRGVTLDEEIRTGAPFSVSRALEIAEQIAAGLGEAHRLGFVHRDVKPTNIMLYREDGQERVKVLDFGTVGLRTETYDARLTAAGFLIGTPAYMAPEQACDPSNVTPAGDFYSLGVILYEMVTGALPFSATKPVEMILQHSIAPLPELPYAGGLDSLIRWSMEKHPADRPQTAQEIIDELARVRRELESDDDMATQEILLDRNGGARHDALSRRLEKIRQTLNGTPMSADVRRTFDARVAQMVASARPGLQSYRYLDLAAEIAALERELSMRH
jgi:serine/threonine-protein kinase